MGAFEHFVRNRDDDEKDWQASLVLQLGSELQQTRMLATAIESAALTATFRPAGEALVSWFASWFEKLTIPAREKWWIGLYMLSAPEVGANIGDGRWGEAASAFGEAVALELKARVFKPFASQSKPPETDPVWQRVLVGRGTLGEMVQRLVQVQVPQTTSAKELREWLARLPTFNAFVTKRTRDQLFKLPNLRNPAQHDTISETEARIIFVEASEWLRALTADSTSSSV